MNDFAASRWADRDFARAFRNEADSYIPFRHRVIEITLSLYQHLSGGNPGSKVLDLGCGDGFFYQCPAGSGETAGGGGLGRRFRRDA